jgi:hypothetical protein
MHIIALSKLLRRTVTTIYLPDSDTVTTIYLPESDTAGCYFIYSYAEASYRLTVASPLHIFCNDLTTSIT